MEMRTFIVVAIAGGKPLCNPIACFCGTHEEAHDLATAKIAGMFDAAPLDTVLYTSDTETDLVYANQPPEMKDQDESKDAGCGGECGDAEACKCPTNDNCRFLDGDTGACKFKEQTDTQPHTAGAKLCAGPAEDLGPGYPEEGRVYGPDELLFAIGPYDHINLIPDLLFVVYLTIASDYEKTGYATDDLGGHNIDNAALRAAGLCEAELMESVFEVNPLKGDTREALATRLLDAGFGYKQAFQDFIDGHLEDEKRDR